MDAHSILAMRGAVEMPPVNIGRGRGTHRRPVFAVMQVP